MTHLIIYSSYLAFPFLLFLIYATWRTRKELRKKKSWLLILVFLYALTISFLYARFIERYLIKVQTTTIETGFEARIILASDMHLGAYKSAHFLERVVEKINQQKDIDAVLIPGDFTYHPPKDLEQLFSILKEIKFPVYAVLGNHDSEKPGPPIQEELREVLENSGVIFLSNTAAQIPGTNIQVLGLGDNWAHEDDISQIENYSETDNLIVLTHNPDTTLTYENSIPDLTVAGHTHGGQVRLPFIYKYTIPCTGDFDQGLYQNDIGQVFITSGLGEVGLPLRLGIPPVIDILELR